jgi:hypothetical protein
MERSDARSKSLSGLDGFLEIVLQAGLIASLLKFFQPFDSIFEDRYARNYIAGSLVSFGRPRTAREAPLQHFLQ